MREKVLEYLLKIPRGRVVTFGQIGAALGDARLARAVGNALHRNPDGEKYPCYKVVSARGKLSESFAFGGLEGQKRHLEADGIAVVNGRVDLQKYQWNEA